MLSNELLSNVHGQVALRAVHRFLAHNPEWVGQTVGAGLGPESEDGAGGAAGVEHKIVPWGYCMYRQTASHDMISNVGGINIGAVMSYTIDWEAGYRFTQDAPEVVVQLLLNRRAEMTEVVDTDDAEKKMLEEIKQFSVRSGGITRQVTPADTAA